jgi:hypothetical protein
MKSGDPPTETDQASWIKLTSKETATAQQLRDQDLHHSRHFFDHDYTGFDGAFSHTLKETTNTSRWTAYTAIHQQQLNPQRHLSHTAAHTRSPLAPTAIITAPGPRTATRRHSRPPLAHHPDNTGRTDTAHEHIRTAPMRMLLVGASGEWRRSGQWRPVALLAEAHQPRSNCSHPPI